MYKTQVYYYSKILFLILCVYNTLSKVDLMGMPIDAKKVLDRVKNVTKKKAFTFSLDPDLMTTFKELCDKDDVSQAPIVEEVIREYVDARTKKK